MQSQILQICILVLFFRFSSKSTCHTPIGSESTWQAINSTQCQISGESRATSSHKQIPIFSLQFSWIKIHNKLRKLKNLKNIQTLTIFSELKFNTKATKIHQSSEILDEHHHWIVFLRNSSANSLPLATNSSTITKEKKGERILRIPNRFREEKKKENKEFHGSESLRRRRRFTVSFEFQARTSTKNRIKAKRFEDSSPNLRTKPGKRSKTYFLFCWKTSMNPNQRKSMADSKSFGSNQ